MDMITDDDLYKEVKLRLLNSELVRGTVQSIGADSAIIRTEGGEVNIKFNRISTVTRVGDYSSDRDTR
jgi:hypothetical protein